MTASWRAMLTTPFVLGAMAGLAAVAGPYPAVPRDEPQAKAPAPPDAADRDVATFEAACRWAATPPVLDGKLDDRCWHDAAPITKFAAYWDNKTPRPGTRAFLAWDNEALYYAATMTDAELRSFGTHRNDILWDGDVFEMFFKPAADAPPYYEFQANPKALVFECYFPKRGVYPKDISQAPVLGNTAAVRVEGTLDHPGDTDTSWTVEGRIPWTAFQPTGGKPNVGDEWRFALCRYDHGPAGTKPVLMSCAPLTKGSFHQHEDYGKLRFEGPRATRSTPSRRTP